MTRFADYTRLDLCGAFGVVAADILRLILAVVNAVDVQLAAAVRAIHQSCQRVDVSPSVRAAFDTAANTLYVIERGLVNNRFVGVLKDCPLAFIDVMTFLVLEVFTGLEVDRVTAAGLR